jgi:hypothetical protein
MLLLPFQTFSLIEKRSAGTLPLTSPSPVPISDPRVHPCSCVMLLFRRVLPLPLDVHPAGLFMAHAMPWKMQVITRL